MTLSRRHILTALAATLALPRIARADIACRSGAPGEEICQAGLPFSPDMRTAGQECQFWCWAACIEAIFALNGHTVRQAEIVSRLYGQPACVAADGPTIANAIAGAWIGAEGRSFRADPQILIDAQYGVWREDAHIVAARELEAGRPLVLGALSHAVLLTAMTFARAPGGATQVIELVIRDPWPTNPNRQVLSWRQAQQISFLTTVRVL